VSKCPPVPVPITSDVPSASRIASQQIPHKCFSDPPTTKQSQEDGRPLGWVGTWPPHISHLNIFTFMKLTVLALLSFLSAPTPNMDPRPSNGLPRLDGIATNAAKVNGVPGTSFHHSCVVSCSKILFPIHSATWGTTAFPMHLTRSTPPGIPLRLP